MNLNDEMKKWLTAWFSKHTGHDTPEIEAHADENYFELGYIDSFGFIELIEELEETHELTFENDAFEDRAFATINGLAQICAGLKQQEK